MKPCKTCAHISRCRDALGCTTDDRIGCDWSPSRYVPSRAYIEEMESELAALRDQLRMRAPEEVPIEEAIGTMVSIDVIIKKKFERPGEDNFIIGYHSDVYGWCDGENEKVSIEGWYPLPKEDA